MMSAIEHLAALMAWVEARQQLEVAHRVGWRPSVIAIRQWSNTSSRVGEGGFMARAAGAGGRPPRAAEGGERQRALERQVVDVVACFSASAKRPARACWPRGEERARAEGAQPMSPRVEALVVLERQPELVGVGVGAPVHVREPAARRARVVGSLRIASVRVPGSERSHAVERLPHQQGAIKSRGSSTRGGCRAAPRMRGPARRSPRGSCGRARTDPAPTRSRTRFRRAAPAEQRQATSAFQSR